MNKREWYVERVTSKIKSRAGIKSKKENFGERQYYSSDIVADMMGKMLENSIPFAVGRQGMGELNWLIEEEQKDDMGQAFFARSYEDGAWDSIEKNRRQFVEITREAYGNIDILANWYNCSLGENILIQKYTKKDLISTDSIIVSPFLQEKPWSKFLQGKKVLVISPFTEEILRQYRIREKLYKNPDVLPEFELKTYKAIWIQDFIKKHHCTYQDIYNKYLEDIFQIDFEVALISCSVPSFALAAEIKKRGRTGIQIGGGLQIFFGIMGKRWDEMESVKRLYNKYWIRLEDSSKPSDAETLDKSCYW